MNDLISVIIPVYNRKDVLLECINSVIAQSYKNFEIILIDDGSTDGTIELCRNLAEQEPRIKLIEAEHGGVSAARNKGIENSNGDFIFFLDSDDIIHPEILKTLIDGMKESNVGVSGTDIINIPERLWHTVNDRIAKDNLQGETVYKNNSEVINAIINGNSPVSVIGGVMFRHDLIGDTRFRTDLFIGEDYYFLYENIIKGTDALFSKQKRYYCRIHTGNSSNKYDFNAFWNRFYRRELVWKTEEKFGRTENANKQKIDAIGCYLRCIPKNKPHSEDVKKMQNTLKKYKKDLFTALSFKKRIVFYIYLYAPFTYFKISKTLKGITLWI